MPSCAAYGCSNQTSGKKRKTKGNENVIYHRFPKNKVLQAEWVQKMRRDFWLPSQSSRLCSIHFTKDSYQKSYNDRNFLKKDAVPTIFPSFLEYFQKKVNHFKENIQRSLGNISRPNQQLQLTSSIIASSICYCSVIGCCNYKGKDGLSKTVKQVFKKRGRKVVSNRSTETTNVFFYEFPKDKELRKKWLTAAGRKNSALNVKMCICSVHFDKSCFGTVHSKSYNTKLKLLKKEAVPTLSVFPFTKSKESLQQVRSLEVNNFSSSSSKSYRMSSLITMNSKELLEESQNTCGVNNSNLVNSVEKHVPEEESIISIDSVDNSELTRISSPSSSFPSAVQSSQVTFLPAKPPILATESITHPWNTGSTLNSSSISCIPLNNLKPFHIEVVNEATKVEQPSANITGSSDESSPLESATIPSEAKSIDICQTSSSNVEKVSNDEENNCSRAHSPNDLETVLSSKPGLTIKNDLAHPVLIFETLTKLIVAPITSSLSASSATTTTAAAGATSTFLVNSNSSVPSLSSAFPKSIQSVPQEASVANHEPVCTCSRFYSKSNVRSLRKSSKQIMSSMEVKLRDKIAKQSNTLKVLQSSRIRFDKRIEDMKKTLKMLRRGSEESVEPLETLPEIRCFYKELAKRHVFVKQNAPSKFKFGKEMQNFAMRLFFCSPEAYTYVRNSFEKVLPSQKVLQKWFQNSIISGTEDKPESLEFTEETVQRLFKQDCTEGKSKSDSESDAESVSFTLSSDNEEPSSETVSKVNVKTEAALNFDTDETESVDMNCCLDEELSETDSELDFEMAIDSLVKSESLAQDMKEEEVVESFLKTEKENTYVMKLKSGESDSSCVVQVKSNVEPEFIPGTVFETYAI